MHWSAHIPVSLVGLSWGRTCQCNLWAWNHAIRNVLELEGFQHWLRGKCNSNMNLQSPSLLPSLILNVTKRGLKINKSMFEHHRLRPIKLDKNRIWKEQKKGGWGRCESGRRWGRSDSSIENPTYYLSFFPASGRIGKCCLSKWWRMTSKQYEACSRCAAMFVVIFWLFSFPWGIYI